MSACVFVCVWLGMSVFVAFFVLLLVLAESTPPAASSIPLIGEFDVQGGHEKKHLTNCRISRIKTDQLGWILLWIS